MAGNRHIPKLKDKAFAAWLKNRFFQVELPADTSIERQHAAISLVEQEILEKIMPVFLQAVVDDDREKVKALLEEYPQLLLVKPGENYPNLVIESKLTWQQFYAEDALTMAVKRKQIKMIELLLPYYDKLEQTEDVIKAKEEALAAWKPYKIQKNEIVIPQEYAALAQSLIDVFKEETFPNGVPGANGIAMNVALSEETELALSSLLNILVPKKAVKLDEHIDEELLLLALYQAYIENFAAFNNDWNKLDALCIRLMGLTQSALIPETGEIICEGLIDIVTAIQNGEVKEISPDASAHRLKSGKDLYRSSRDSRSGSGFDFLCDIYAGGGPTAWPVGLSATSMGALPLADFFEKTMSSKSNQFSEITRLAATAKPSPSK